MPVLLTSVFFRQIIKTIIKKGQKSLVKLIDSGEDHRWILKPSDEMLGNRISAQYLSPHRSLNYNGEKENVL